MIFSTKTNTLPLSVATTDRFRRKWDFWRSIFSGSRLVSLESRDSYSYKSRLNFVGGIWYYFEWMTSPRYWYRSAALLWQEEWTYLGTGSVSVGRCASCCPWEVERSAVAGATWRILRYVANKVFSSLIPVVALIDMIERCSASASASSTSKESPLHVWIWASRPGQRVHIYFAGYMGQTFLVIVDNYS